MGKLDFYSPKATNHLDPSISNEDVHSTIYDEGNHSV